MNRKRKHDDTSVSLHPLTFDEAMAKLARGKRDSQAEESGSTTAPAPSSAPSKKGTAP